ncbi:MAG: tetratricopeptide (TPR) repeat protein, partial [Gammaproteobacteria bacterium]
RRPETPSKIPWIVGVALLVVVAVGVYWFQIGSEAVRSNTGVANQKTANSESIASVGDTAENGDKTPSVAKSAAPTLKETRVDAQEGSPILAEPTQPEGDDRKVEVAPVGSEIDKLVERSKQLGLLAKNDKGKIPELVRVYRKILSIDNDQKVAVRGLAGFKKNALSAAEKRIKSGSFSSAQKELSNAILLFPELDRNKKYVELNRQLSQHVRVEKLLAKGEEGLSQDRLVTPPGNNAQEIFNEVLVIDSNNKMAQSGLEKIVERFISLADAARTQKDYEQSLGFVNNGLQVDDENEALRSLRGDLQVLMLEEQNVEQVVEQLLVDAVEFETQQLLFGEGENAAHNYQKILAMDSSNIIASEGLSEIKNYSFSLLTELILKKDFALAQSTLLAALVSFPGDETLIGMRMELEESRPLIDSLLISGTPFSDPENAIQPEGIAVERTLFLVLNYSGFQQAATVLQVILWDGGRSLRIAAKPIVLSGNSGSYQFEIDRAVEGFNEGGYHIDILQAGKSVYSLAFVIGR